MTTTIFKKVSVTVASIAILAASTVGATFAQGNANAQNNQSNQNMTQMYQVRLSPLNNSGVRSHAQLKLTGNQLNVRLYASGLEGGKEHLQHIHGKVDGSSSVCPGPGADTDTDGTVDLMEGLPFYGPILQSLTPFPTTETEVYNQTFTVDTSDPTKNVLPLENREIVLHGKTVKAGEDKTFNNGGAGYDVTLPIACGHIVRIGNGMGNGSGSNGNNQSQNGTGINISGNGRGSRQDVDISSFNTTHVMQSNDTRVNNNVDSNLNTGNNHANDNLNGNTRINSGDAMSWIKISNMGGMNMLNQ
ncbi:hypothetical protein BH09PAT1_BH09PAT1_3070 [soil metagenome]